MQGYKNICSREVRLGISRIIHAQKYNRISGSPFSPSRNNEKISSVGFRGPVPSLKKRISITLLAQVFGIAIALVALTGTSIQTEASETVVEAGLMPVIVLDPGHGGSDIGIQGRSLLSEKDWTWKLAYQVRLSLIATGKFNVVMTRIGDQLRSIDQRAITANTNRGAAFVSFHLINSRTGKQVAIPYLYQAPLNSKKVGAPEGPSFVSWGEVQNSHLPESLKLAQYLKNEFFQIANIEAREPTLAPVRLLQSVNSPAVLIEFSNVNSLESRKGNENSKFILQLAQTITRAIKKFSYKNLSNQ